MKELAFSKQINERKDLFPWLNIFLTKLVRKFPNDLDKELLQFLLQNIEEEINSLSNSEDTKRQEALFNTIVDLFLHFWWRIRWNGKKKWSRCWKTVSSKVSYAHDERTKCCEKLLYYIIYLGMILSNGFCESKWIGKVFETIFVLPSFDDMVYSSLLQVNNLNEMYLYVYTEILKYVLCSEVAQNISEAVTYVKIIMLFRRLKMFTVNEKSLSALNYAATSIKPPSDTIQWLLSFEIDVSLEKPKSIAKALLSNKFSNKIFQKLHQVITGTADFVLEKNSLSDVSEEMDKQTDISHKRKQKSHKSHSVEKLKDSTASCNTDINAASTSTPFYNSKVKIKLNHKLLAGFHTSPRLKELKQKKKNHLKNNVSRKEFNDGLSIIKVNDMNEFLNFSFAEISNFSKSVTPQPPKLKYATESTNGNEDNFLSEETDSSLSLYNANINSHSNHKRKQAKFRNGSLVEKRIKLDAEKDCSEIQSAQKKNPLNSNKPANVLPENNVCSKKTTGSVELWFVPSPSHSPGYPSTEDNATKVQPITLKKVPIVSLVDVKNIEKSALLKLVQPLAADLTSSLPIERSINSPIENGTKQFDIDCNHLNTVTEELCEITHKTNHSELYNEVSHNIVNNIEKLNIDCNLSNANISTNKSYGALQENGYSKQNFEIFPIANIQNNGLSQIDCENINSAISTNEFSNLLCSTNNSNESVDRSIGFANFEDHSLRSCNNLACSGSWVENSLGSKRHRWDESQSAIPSTSKTLEFTQTNVTNSQNNSVDNIQHSALNSEIFHESNSINQRADGRVCTIQNENTANCVVDCKIVNDYDPNNSQNNESTSSIKVIINVTCKTPEGSSSQQKEHIFGNFDDKTTKQRTPNTSKNYFNSLNPFFIESSNSDMPKLTPYYDDPPVLTRSIDAIATPPDSELDINVPSTFKRDNIGSSKNIINKKLLSKQTCPSTPKSASSAFPKKRLTNDSDFRTPNTSDCETSNEWCLENTNLTNSLLLINSLQNSPVDKVLEQLNSRTPGKNNTLASAATLNSCSKKKVTYRNYENLYSGNNFSDDSTISCFSRISTTDNELNCALKKRAIHTESKDDFQQKPNKVFRKKRKSPLPKKWQLKGLPDDSSIMANHRYNLRSREKLHKPSKLEDFS